MPESDLMLATPARAFRPFYTDLFFQVIAAIVIGVLVGHFFPTTAIAMKPLGDAFINLIKMMIAPIIFCTIVSGIVGMDDAKQVGRVGAKAILYFEVMTVLALIIGLVLVELVKPGAGLHIDVSTVDVSAMHDKIAHVAPHSTIDFLLNIIPTTLVSAFVSGEILQVLLIAILFAFALKALGAVGKPVVSGINLFATVIFKMVDIITRVAPLGAFGAMAYTVGKYGVGSLQDLGELILLFYAAGLFFIFAILAPILRFYCGLSLWKFLRYLREELLIVLGTSSSETVLPRLMEKLETMGCSKPVVGMVVPAGYSFNLDGSSLYFTMGAIFIAYATQTPITLWQEVTLLGVLLITSKGAAGVTGSAFIVLAATLTSMKFIPEEKLQIGLALIFAVDRFMSTGRAMINLIGNGVATLVIAKWEKALDHPHAYAVLAGESATLPVPRA